MPNHNQLLEISYFENRVLKKKRGICKLAFTDSPYSCLLRRFYFGEDEVLGEGDAISCFIGEAEVAAMVGEAELIAFVAGVP